MCPPLIQTDPGSTNRRADVDDEKFVTIQKNNRNISRIKIVHFPASLDEESE